MIALPTVEEFRQGCIEYQKKEPRDVMYKAASFLVEQFWNEPRRVAESLAVLLLTWNNAFYRYGLFDFDKLEEAIRSERERLDFFRHREILSYSASDDSSINDLFGRFLEALQRPRDGKKKGARSPVAVAKALHLLAPRFFPLWDAAIAAGYDRAYSQRPAENYRLFLADVKKVVAHLAGSGVADTEGKSLLKLVDEYNYARFTLPAQERARSKRTARDQ